MRKINALLLIAITSFWLSSCTQSPESDNATTSEAKEVVTTPSSENAYTVDAASSSLKWIGTKVTGYHTGTFGIQEGKLFVSDNNISGGEVTISTKDLQVVGPKDFDSKMNQKLQGHLLSPDFFEVEKYPTAKFVITGVKPFTGTAVTETEDPRQEEINEYKITNPTHLVSGNLTIKDVTKNIEFPALVSVSENGVEAKAKFNINRKNWGLTYPGKPDDLIRDDVHIGLNIKATM